LKHYRKQQTNQHTRTWHQQWFIYHLNHIHLTRTIPLICTCLVNKLNITIFSICSSSYWTWLRKVWR